MYYAEIPVPCREMAPVHAALRAYFADGAERPFLWRLVDGSTVGMLSAEQPSTPSIRLTLEAGRTYAFETVVKLSKDRSKARAERRDAQLSRVPEAARTSIAWHWTPRQAVEALRARMAEGGCEMAFHRFGEATELKFAKGAHKVAFRVARVTGLLKVVDPAAAEAMLLAGAPRGGKAWGCGMIALPEIMRPSSGNRIAPPRTLYASIGEAA